MGHIYIYIYHHDISVYYYGVYAIISSISSIYIYILFHGIYTIIYIYGSRPKTHARILVSGTGTIILDNPHIYIYIYISG